MPEVSYISPDRCDWLDYEQKLVHQHAITLCGKDVVVLLQNIRYLPKALLPVRLANPLPGVRYNYAILARDYFLTTLVTIVELLLLMAAVPALTLLYGWTFLVYCAMAAALVASISSIMWGELTVHSQSVFDGTFPTNEKWIFVNGIGTSHAMLQTTCDMLAATFRRPITGIHNRSYGILVDVFECVIMRSFGYKSKAVHSTYEHMRSDLEDERIAKLVVIAHSQGGMITSLALDHLYTHLPSDPFSKLEIYTFGSAATHFHNPLLRLPLAPLIRTATNLTDVNKPPARYIPIIEHYVNSADIVPRWGVLYHVRRKPADGYAGRVFIHEGATGHLFDQHYLEPMFPLLGMRSEMQGTRRDRCEQGGRRDPRLFVNHGVIEDVVVGVGRARTWIRGEEGMEGRDGGASQGGGRGVEGRREVRELSRLWRYVDGGVA